MMSPISLSDTPNAVPELGPRRLHGAPPRPAAWPAARSPPLRRAPPPSVAAAWTGRRAISMRAPTSLARQSRERSIASPSDTSIIEVTPCAGRIAASPTRGTGRIDRRSASRSSSDQDRCDDTRSPAAAPPSEPGHDDAVAGPRSASAHGPARPDLAGHAHDDRQLASAREVASHQRERELVAALPHPAGELDDPCRVDRVGQRERAEREPRAAGHRRDVADVHRDRLVAEVARRRRDRGGSAPPRPSRRWSARAHRNRRRTTAASSPGPDEDLGTGTREHPPDRGDQFVFGEVHLGGLVGRERFGRRPLGRSLDSRLSVSPRGARVHRFR